MEMKRKSYTAECKRKVVLESMQRDTTQEEVCKRFGIASSMLHRWRKEFEAHAASVFHDQRDPKQKAYAQGYEPGESPADLNKMIGELTVQNAIRKKASGLVRKYRPHPRWNWHISCVGLTAPRPKARWLEHWASHAERCLAQASRRGKTKRWPWHEQDDTRSPSQTGSPAQDGEKARQARPEEIGPRCSSHKEARRLSWQGEECGPHSAARRADSSRCGGGLF